MSPAGSRLRALVRRGGAPVAVPAPRGTQGERCDLCAAPIQPGHRHLLDLTSGEPQCACRACVILFDRGEAGGEHYRLVPERRLCLEGFRFEERLWVALGIPVDLAFLSLESVGGRVLARYPSPLGLTTAVPAPDAWEQVMGANPVLAGMEPDVEALLLSRARGAREHWLVPVDDCFRLAARVREHWSGFAGGERVWEEIARFFEDLHARHALMTGEETA